jgi:hypothetical protein
MKFRRLAPTLAASVVLSLTLAAPAVGSVAAGSLFADCGPDDHAAARGPVDGRIGKVREKNTGQIYENIPASAQNVAAADFEATIPVYFHVITDGEDGALTDEMIDDQLDVLNVTYGGGEGGADTGFTFELAAVTHTNSAYWFALSDKKADGQMKRALRQGGTDAMNVYSTSGGAFLGYAYYPSILDSQKPHLDGIVIDYRTVPGASDAYEGLYDEGKTLTHEAGHWLNLAHTFEGKCSVTGDHIDDTPAQKSPTFGCPEGKDTCKRAGADPIHNYMDYSDDPCYSGFTEGQAQRMADAWLLYRAP